MRVAIATCVYSVAILGLLTSLLGTLLLSAGFWLLGGAIFLFIFFARILLLPEGTARHRPFALPTLWRFVVPLFVLPFLLVIALSLNRGAPDLGDLPVFAEREVYSFTQTVSVERWRFVTVAASFHFIWHLLIAAFAADDLAFIAQRSRVDRR